LFKTGIVGAVAKSSLKTFTQSTPVNQTSTSALRKRTDVRILMLGMGVVILLCQLVHLPGAEFQYRGNFLGC
jgi:hypothetical protein